MTMLPAAAAPAGDVRTAPGAQGRLFAPECATARLHFVVVDVDGARTPSVARLGTAAAQANAAARAGGRSWVEGTDGRTVEITFRDDTVIVAPREPGWPATIARPHGRTGRPREEIP